MQGDGITARQEGRSGRGGGREGFGGRDSRWLRMTVTVVAAAEVSGEVVEVSKGHDIAFETRDCSS